MDSNQALAPDVAPQLTPLNGIRFFAVFHIFLLHLWAMFSIFVWQNFLMIVSFYVAYMTGKQQVALPVAIVGLLAISIASTYLIEEPWAKRLRREH